MYQLQKKTLLEKFEIGAIKRYLKTTYSTASQQHTTFSGSENL
jgi:hypothetical protein